MALLVTTVTFGCNTSTADSTSTGLRVEVVPDMDAQRVDISVDGELFTSYLFTDTLAMLKKPVLFPIRTANGTGITRGFPLEQRPGERTDHPHHIGFWFNYGDVNKLDFWNNSDAIPASRADEMGTIRHQEITDTKSGDGVGELSVIVNWLKPDGSPLLRENTHFVFHAKPNVRIIDRIATLTALDEQVVFEDNKEGALGLRVTRALEMPTSRPITMTDAAGNPTDVPVMDNVGVTGYYRNSEGIAGYPDVWGKRARWMTLSGVVDGEAVTVAIFDHPQNVGYPTYWHARDYGLFAANPLGQAAFSNGEEVLNFTLEPGEQTTLRYRLVIFSGDVETAYEDFAGM